MITLDEFLAYEKEHDLSALQYKGVFYWQMIRATIRSDIAFNELDKGNNNHIVSIQKSKRNWVAYLGHLPSQVKHFFDSGRYDVFASYNYANRIMDGKSMNPYVDFLDKCGLKIKHHTIWSRNNWTKEDPAKSNSTLIELSWRFFFSKFATLHRKRGQHDYADKLCEIIGDLNARYDSEVDFSKYNKKVFNETWRFCLYKKYYRHILKNKYRAVFIGYYASTHNFALIAAAKECGIPVIEHQHGMINKAHTTYNLPESSFAGVYCPNYFFTFGEYWSEQCRLPAHTKVVAVGSPQFDEAVSFYAGKEKEAKKIVYICDYSLGHDITKQVIVLARLAAPLGYEVTIKLHPKEYLSWREKFPWLAEAVGELSNLICVSGPVSPYELLSGAQHIVGVNSTVLYEALAFGCHIYFWDMGETQPEGFIMDAYLVDRGHISRFKTEKELLALIESAKPNDTAPEFSSMLFKPNAVANIRRELSRIIA